MRKRPKNIKYICLSIKKEKVNTKALKVNLFRNLCTTLTLILDFFRLKKPHQKIHNLRFCEKTVKVFDSCS